SSKARPCRAWRPCRRAARRSTRLRRSGARVPLPLRIPLVAGNWKMHGTNDQAARLVRAVLKALGSAPGADVVLFPPFTALTEASYLLAGTPVALGGQDL